MEEKRETFGFAVGLLLSIIGIAAATHVLFVTRDYKWLVPSLMVGIGMFFLCVAYYFRLQREYQATRKQLMDTSVRFGHAIGTIKDLRERVCDYVEDLASHAQRIFEERKPTNERMRHLRRFVIDDIFEELQKGDVQLYTIKAVMSPEVMRDAVEDKLAKSEFNLTSGPEWQRQLVEWTFKDQKPPVAKTTPDPS